MAIDRRKYLYRIKRLEIKSWLKYLMIEGKSVVDYVLGELTSGTDIAINNTVKKKFYKFDIKGNSIQDGTPTPDSPVEILSAGDNGTISEKIVNKNFCKITSVTPYYYTSGLPSTQSTTLIIDSFDSNSISFHTTTNAYNIALSNVIQLKPNTQYTIKFSRTTTATNNQWFIYDYYNGTYSINYRDNNTNTLEKTFTTNSLGQIVLAFGHGNVTGTTTISNIQLEQGSTATTYVAHQEQTYTIPVQQPMRSIGTVRDEFIKVNGVWKERHNIGRVLCVGAETEQYTREKYEDLYIRFTMVQNNMLNTPANTRQIVVSNYFKFASSGSDIGSIFRFNNNIYMYPDKTTINTVEQFKTWLSTHNTEVIYQLATPVDLPCTEEQISILENLPKSYNEQTNIYSLDVTPAYIEVQVYVKKEEE